MLFVVAIGTGSQWWVANGGEHEVEAMSWHIIDVTGHSALSTQRGYIALFTWVSADGYALAYSSCSWDIC